MNILLFSQTKIFYEDAENKAITGIFIPSISHEQVFPDLENPNTQAVKVRYGDPHGPTPLWREKAGYVYAYGNLQEEIEGNRRGVRVFLPQDFVGEDVDSFFFVFGETVLVHGARKIDDDEGEASRWGVFATEVKAGKMVEVLAEAVGERMLEGARNILVAAHGGSSLKADITEILKSFEIDLQDFSTLSVPKSVKPLYMHRDYSLVFLLATLVLIVSLVVSSALAVHSSFRSSGLDDEISELSDRLSSSQKGVRLGNIRNPNEYLNKMEQVFKSSPSTILHAAGSVGALFGRLDGIVVKPDPNAGRRSYRRRNQPEFVEVVVTVDNTNNLNLIDQESLAQEALENRPWIRSINTFTSTGNKVTLNIVVQTSGGGK